MDLDTKTGETGMLTAAKLAKAVSKEQSLDRIADNAFKFALLAYFYPDCECEQLLGIMQVPRIDANIAVIDATALGIVKVSKPKKGAPKKNGKAKFTGEDFDAADAILSIDFDMLPEKILRAMNEEAKSKNDIDQETMTAWLQGYPLHDAVLSLKLLERDGKISKYVVVNRIEEGDNAGEELYPFFTLSENRQKEWGRKAFKDQSRISVKEYDEKDFA